LAVVKYPTVANAPSEARTAIPRFIAVLDASTLEQAGVFAPYTSW